MEPITKSRLPTIERESAYVADQSRDWLAEELPFMYFAPWAKQEAAIRATQPWNLWAWANRTGKTTGGACYIVMALMGLHPTVPFPEPPWISWACSVDYKQMRDSIMPALEGDSTHPRMLPRPTTFNAQQNSYTLPHPYRYFPPENARVGQYEGQPGSILRLKSAESGRDAFQGAALPLMWWDEELPEAIITEMLVRLPPGFIPRIVWTMTAVKGLSYAYDHIYVPWREWQEEHPGEEHPGEEHPDIFYSEATMFDAPHITDEQIQRIRSGFRPDSRELEVRLRGGFRDLAGESIFSAEAIEWHKPKCREPVRTIYIEYDSSAATYGRVRDYDNLADPWKIRIWNLPDMAHYYTAGMDFMEGKLSDPNNEDSSRDWNSGVIYDRTASEIVSVVRNRLHPIDHAKAMWLLCWWFNQSWAAGEVNAAGTAGLGVFIGKADYPPYTRMYQRRKDFDEWSEEIVSDDLWWRTQINTRGLVVQHMVSYLDFDQETGREPICKFHDSRILEEMIAFQRNKSGKIEHMRGRHDDLLFACGLAFEADLKCPHKIARISGSAGPNRQRSGFMQSAVEGGTRGDVVQKRLSAANKRR